MVVIAICTAFTPSYGYADSKYAALIVNADNGVVLYQESAGEYRYPASLTKLMTLYLTFQALERGKLKMNKFLPVSARAAGQPPSKMGLARGDNISVRDAILSLVIKSANDVAVVLAEAVGGSEWQFALMMNRTAKKLGMDHTNFRNASGLHDPRQKTTAYDLAKLAIALKRDYPQYYSFFNRTEFTYKGRTQATHNYVVKKYRGADGLKTGYVNASGYNLVTSATRDGYHLVGVVMGGRTSRTRDAHMMKLLDQIFYKLTKEEGKTKVKTASESSDNSDAPIPILKPEQDSSTANAPDLQDSKEELPPESSYKDSFSPAENENNDEIPLPSLKPV